MQKYLWLTLIPFALFAAKVDYTVDFIGLDDAEALKTLKAVSDLTTLKEKPPDSINALRYRSDSDIPELLKVLHAYGYYEATVNIRIEELDDEVRVFVMIQPGPQYTIQRFSITLAPPSDALSEILEHATLSVGKPALAAEILEAEEKILSTLAEHGYPLASVEKREMVADGKEHSFRICLAIETGPFARFGPSDIKGKTKVKKEFIDKKTAWKEDNPYQSSLVEKTQSSLMDTGLFSSVLVTHGGDVNAQQELPMQIEATANKHSSINMGVSYQTFYGPGITLGWENRNLGGMGRRLSIQGDATRRTHSGIATFLAPDFYRVEQDFVAQAEAMQESIYTYDQHSYSILNRVERRIDTRYRLSMGVKFEREFVSESVDNGVFSLIEIPLYFRFSSANDLLDPTQGTTLEYRLMPAINCSYHSPLYLTQTVSYMLYLSPPNTNFFVFAQQISVESILSGKLDAIPVPKRVLGGTEQELRGYRYRTVSPLEGHKPIGGRSGIFYTVETRFRVNKKIGLVPFFDLGSVYLTVLPQLRGTWYTSTGLGIRYFSFLGPLRFDIAFPLNRRKWIDPHYRFLVSIGQTF